MKSEDRTIEEQIPDSELALQPLQRETETFAELFSAGSVEEVVEEVVAGGKHRLEEMLAQARDLGLTDDERDRAFEVLRDIELKLTEQAVAYEEAHNRLLQESRDEEDRESFDSNSRSDWSRKMDKANLLNGELNRLSSLIYNTRESAKTVRDTAQYVEILPEGGIDVDIDALLEERQHLENKQAMYKPIIKELFHNPEEVDSETWRAVWQKTEQRLRTETDVLGSYDEEKIDLFGEDLTRQPAFADVRSIKFIGDVKPLSPDDRSRVLKAKKIEDVADLVTKYQLDCTNLNDLYFLKNAVGKKIGGEYRPGGLVYINNKQPTLEERIQMFVRAGRLIKSVQTLVHELRHHGQHKSGLDIMASSEAEVLGEAQSFFHHPLSGEPQRLVEDIKNLTNQDRSYQFSDEMTIQATNAVEKLNALGLSQAKISEIIARSDWDENLNRYVDIDRQIFDMMKDRGIDEEDLALLQDELRLKRKNDVLQAQMIAQEELCRALGDEKIEKIMTKSKPSLEVGSTKSLENTSDQYKLIIHDATVLPVHLHERQSFVLTPTGEPNGFTVGRLTRRYADDGTMSETEKLLNGDEQRALEEKLTVSLSGIDAYDLADASGFVLNQTFNEQGEEAVNRFDATFGSLAGKMRE